MSQFGKSNEVFCTEDGDAGGGLTEFWCEVRLADNRFDGCSYTAGFTINAPDRAAAEVVLKKLGAVLSSQSPRFEVSEPTQARREVMASNDEQPF